MLLEQTIEKLSSMRLLGMCSALHQWQNGGERQVEAADLIGILADAEWVYRENNKYTARMRKAKFKYPMACVEDIIYRPDRGLAKTVVSELSSPRWIVAHKPVIINGPTGSGKSYIGCALGQMACRNGFDVLYKRTPRLFDELAQAHADGSYALALRRLLKAPVLVLDDFCMQPLDARARRDLIEVLEDRYSAAATVICSQLTPKDWHAAIGDETVADSVCDRLVHGAHRINLRGESIRKVMADAEVLRAEDGASLTQQVKSTK